MRALGNLDRETVYLRSSGTVISSIEYLFYYKTTGTTVALKETHTKPIIQFAQSRPNSWIPSNSSHPIQEALRLQEHKSRCNWASEVDRTIPNIPLIAGLGKNWDRGRRPEGRNVGAFENASAGNYLFICPFDMAR